jgi:hypothetical protein
MGGLRRGANRNKGVGPLHNLVGGEPPAPGSVHGVPLLRLAPFGAVDGERFGSGSAAGGAVSAAALVSAVGGEAGGSV